MKKKSIIIVAIAVFVLAIVIILFLISNMTQIKEGDNLENKKGKNEVWATYSSISGKPVQSISGTVTYTSGNVSIFKNFLEGV